MCACRCGINVHLKSGAVSYIEGNRDHPVNRGVLCAKGAAGIRQITAPSRLRSSLKRVGPRGTRVIAVNPIRTGYNAIADDWYGVTPDSDGLLILALVHCLLEAGKVDLTYLAQFTNAPYLVAEASGPGKGLILRNAESQPFVIDRRSGQPAPWDGKGVEPDLGAVWQGNRTVFQHLAARYLAPEYAPEAVVERVAFDESIEIAQPWVDFRGNSHVTMPGRPVSFHAMRGISAHSNGFQTTRALHLLQILLGAIDLPGGHRFEPPYPKPMEAHPTPQFTATPGQPLDGPHLGYVRGPEYLAIGPDGRALRIDKAFTSEHPFSAQGLMQVVIPNAHAGEYVIPHIIYSDAYASEMVAYADLILPDTTYRERHDCISPFDRPISDPDAAGDAIRWPVVEPDRDVRPFQSVLIDLGARLGLPGFVAADGSALYADYADYITNHQRRPGVGSMIGFRGDGAQVGRGAPNQGQLDAYIANGGFFQAHVPPEARYYKPWNAGYQDWAVAMGFYESPQPYLFSLYSEPMRKFQLAAEGFGHPQPPEALRARLRLAMDPLPVWYPPCGDDAAQGYPLHALTQRPMDMYHSWGSQNAWLRQIRGRNFLYLPTKVWRAGGFAAGDWARVTSPTGEIVVPVAHLAALNEHTVWTWNAIGKRRGTWGLAPDAPEASKGFLLNHLISELLPARGRPALGQCRSDHRPGGVVRSARQGGAAGAAGCQLAAVCGCWRADRRQAMTALPDHTEKRLGLVIDLDTCVGCQACVTACKGWNDQGAAGPLDDENPYGADPSGVFFNRVHSYQVQPADGVVQIVNFPRSCLHCADAPCVTVCPTGASDKRVEDGIVLVNEAACIGCGLCAWACPYGAREINPARGVMQKCTLCVDRIYNETLPEADREPACVRTCPTGARHFGDLAAPPRPAC